VASNYTGGNGSYSLIRINKDNPGGTYVGSSSSYQWDNLTDGRWYVQLQDSAGNTGTQYVDVNCYIDPTSIPATNTPTPTPSPLPATNTPTPTNTLVPTSTPFPTAEPTAEPTAIPVSFTLTASCPGTNGSTGRIVASDYIGGSGVYTQIRINKNNPGGSWVPAGSTYQWDNLTDGRWWVQLQDTAGHTGTTYVDVICYLAPTPLPATVTPLPATDTPLPATDTPLPATPTPTPDPVYFGQWSIDCNGFGNGDGYFIMGVPTGGVGYGYYMIVDGYSNSNPLYFNGNPYTVSGLNDSDYYVSVYDANGNSAGTITITINCSGGPE
jgi:hypothetical protein